MKIQNLLFVCLLYCQCTLFSQAYAIKTFPISGVKTDYILSQGNNIGTILVLPGWNFSSDDICQKSNFCEKATASGFSLILPNMLKSVYSSQLYPETKTDWRGYPTLKWVTDTMIPWFQLNYKILLKGQNNFVFGISTGGRGVAMVLLYTDSIFKAGAALSGDYNQLKDISDNLMRGYYGEYSNFPERWKGFDNPFLNAGKLKAPLYLSHGKADKVVPYEQTLDFFNEIEKLHPSLGCKLDIDENGGHNYKFWSSKYDNSLEFFEHYSQK